MRSNIASKSEAIRASDTNDASIATDGLEFVEFTAINPTAVEVALNRLGFVCVADHRHKEVRLFRQNNINFIVNAEPNSRARTFANQHGPSSNALAFRVPDVAHALDCARRLDLDVVESTSGPMELNIPAIKGVGGTLIYLVDRYGTESIYDVDFRFRRHVPQRPKGMLLSVDHITQNVNQGELQPHVEFYKRAFGFRELQTFDIRGKRTGLASVALTSPCGRIKIPLNEPTDTKSQIAEFLKVHHGSGVQHIALNTHDIYQAVKVCTRNGTVFQSTPETYYDRLHERRLDRSEDFELLKRYNVLIDGNANDGILLQIFTKDMIGPLFFELIQRKGNQGFGEGNFQALFETIEREQEARGYLDEVV